MKVKLLEVHRSNDRERSKLAKVGNWTITTLFGKETISIVLPLKSSYQRHSAKLIGKNSFVGNNNWSQNKINKSDLLMNLQNEEFLLIREA